MLVKEKFILFSTRSLNKPYSTSILLFSRISIPRPATFGLGSIQPIITFLKPFLTIKSAHEPVFRM